MKKKWNIWSGVIVLGIASAGSMSQAETVFEEVSAEMKIELSSGTASWADFDNDGWVDLNAGGVLWKNDQGKGFTKVAEKEPGVFGDFDNDGFPDLFAYGNQRLYRNKAGQEFVGVALPEFDKVPSLGACWGDMNNDGLLDLYVGGYEDWGNQVTFPDRVFFNENGKSFTIAWSDARYRARGVMACDFDRDNDLDIYVSNYRLQPNVLWVNDGSGNLQDVTKAFNALATSEGFDGGHAVGSAWGDFDNDGQIDIFAGNFAHRDGRGDQPKSRFLRNLGPEKKFVFEDRGTCGVFYQESYASPAAGDYDNDGDLDLFFTAVYASASFGVANYPVLFRNDGDWTFTDVSEAAGVAKLGATYQAAWADFDNDGQLDLIGSGKLFRNKGNKNQWIKIRLEGDGKKINRDAIGAQVRITLKDRTLSRQVEAGTGQGNQNSPVLHFGLGSHAGTVTLEIAWPDGKKQNVKKVKTNELVKVRYSP